MTELSLRPARLIVDPPASGVWNMAVDKALLESAEKTGQITLRFYQWEEPTVTLGYFQKYDSRLAHAPSKNCPLVRRQTGGGAIVHDNELTYSLCIPSSERWSLKNRILYETVHQLIVNILGRYSLESHLFGDLAGEEVREDKHLFLCFQRRAVGDLVAQRNKIVGSAQRRAKKALLQHGSILIGKSDAAPELEGIEELGKFAVDAAELRGELAKLLSNSLSLKLNSDTLTGEEKVLANKFCQEVFCKDVWNRNR